MPTSQPVAGSGTVTFNEYSVLVETQVGNSNRDRSVNYWFVGTAPDPNALATRTLTLPQIHLTETTLLPGTSGVISAGNSIALTAGSLSNKGGQIAAQGSISLNVQSLSNGAVLPTVTAQTWEQVDPAQLSSFFAGLQSLGTIGVSGTGDVNGLAPTFFTIAPGAAPGAGGTLTTTFPTGMVTAGTNLTLMGGNLVNEGLLYAGNTVNIQAQSFGNAGGNQQNFASQAGCAAGVPNYACGGWGHPRGNNPITTAFSYSQNDATVFAGNDLVIAAGQVNNTYGNLLAGHDIVVGGVGTTAGSTTPASSLNNTSGNIVAGNNITLNVSGAITNKLPPPVPVHENYGSKEQYTGCMTAGGYKESYCEGYVDQQSGTSSVISAGNNLKINAGSLTNIGSLISAGSAATINVAGPVINAAQTLNAYWHSHWVQETGMFSSDKRHDIWACGSPAECAALYGDAYTKVGGPIDPPQPVGNIAATIEAPNLTITSGGEIQNVGNVLGTSVALTGQRLINGITTSNTYTPRVNGPSQVISLSPATLPGLNISLPRAVGTGAVPTAVAGQASFVDASLGGTSQTTYSPQVLLSNLPSNLQPSSTLFYYNPQEEDLLLQQAALQQTGKATFVDGLSYDSQNNLSVTEQEKAYLYGNALDYAKANNVQLGQALTQAQVTALDRPMLWYVDQTVPDPSCAATGDAKCPTITALMPQVYLPSSTTALSAGGNIIGHDVTLNFEGNGQGSVLNTGTISASGTLKVDTPTLTNEANQVDVGQIWSKLKSGYIDTTGTEVQPGGFMSAANMDLNVQTLNQIGGALQKLNADGTVDEAGTQQLLATLSQQLGTNFTQQTLTDHLHTDFVKGGGGLPMFVVAAIAIAASIVTAGAAAAAMGATLATMTLGESIVVGAVSAMAGSAASQLASGQGLDFGAILEAGAIGAIAAGITNGITYNSTTGSFGIGNLDQGLNSLPQNTSTLGQLAGISNVGTSLGQAAQAGASTAENLPAQLAALGATATINAGVETAIEGGSFLTNLKGSLVSDGAAAGAFAIGELRPTFMADLGQAGGELAYVGTHAALGCLSAAALGGGCGGGAVGGAASAALAPDFKNLIDPSGAALDEGQRAALGAFGTLLGGSLAGLAGQDEQAGATAAQNEALNNAADHDADGVVGMLKKGLFAASPAMWTATQLLLSKADKLKLHVSIDTSHGADNSASQLNPFDGQDGSSGGPTAGGSAVTSAVGRVLAGVASELELGLFPAPVTPTSSIPKVTFTLSSNDTGSDSASQSASSGGKNASGDTNTAGNAARNQPYGNGSSASPSPGTDAAGNSAGNVRASDATNSADSSFWSSTGSKTAVENAYGHWDKHMSEFPEYQNSVQYVQGAQDFVSNPPAGTLVKTRPNGDTLLYNPSSNTFAVKTINGAPRTMFRPQDGMSYWNKQ